MVPIIIMSLWLSQIVASGHAFRSFERYTLPINGSEAFAFDPENGGPYTTLPDGRIVKYQGPNLGFGEFATTTSNRSKVLCDGKDVSDTKTGLLCGRPEGIAFNKKTGQLYIADVYNGLLVMGKKGSVATQVAGERSDGTHFDFADGIDVDPITGDVYVTDLGTIFTRTTNMSEIIVSGDTTGRLLKYDPQTKKTTLLLSGLGLPAGVAVSRDGSFLLVTEYANCRIIRYWINGPKAHTSEIFVDLPGNPDNIKRTESGEFWVANNIQKLYPKLIPFPLGQRISAAGRVVETVNFYEEYNATSITEVQEHGGSLYVGSLSVNFAGVYTL